MPAQPEIGKDRNIVPRFDLRLTLWAVRRRKRDRNAERDTVNDHVQERADQKPEDQGDRHDSAWRDFDRHAPPKDRLAQTLCQLDVIRRSA